jgi:preprotein translocase SecE subunit
MAVQNAAPAGKQRFRFFNEIMGELRKVVWLSRRESIYLSALVLLLAIVLGIFLGACDWGFAQAAKAVFI